MSIDSLIEGVIGREGGLWCRSRSSFAQNNLSGVGARKPKEAAKLFPVRLIRGVDVSHGSNELVGILRKIAVLAALLVQVGRAGVSAVLFVGVPLKIVGSVVKLVAVLVVNRAAVFLRLKERLGHNAVRQPFVFGVQRHHQIAWPSNGAPDQPTSQSASASILINQRARHAPEAPVARYLVSPLKPGDRFPNFFHPAVSYGSLGLFG